IAMGVVSSARNMEDEQTLRVTDDLARRLVSTIPDDRIAMLDDPWTLPVTVADAAPKPSYQVFIGEVASLPPDQQRARIATALASRVFGDKANAPLLDALTAIEPQRDADQMRYADYLADSGDWTGALARADRALQINHKYADAHYMRGRMLAKLDRIDDAAG